MNETHDPALRSWVATANHPDTDFPVQNLPFGVFRRAGSDEPFRGGVAIGEAIVDLGAASRLGLLSEATGAAAASEPSLNAFMALGPATWSEMRRQLSVLLREGSIHSERAMPALVAMENAEMTVPVRIGDYTDFFCSIEHATNAGRLNRPDNPLSANFRHMPIAYHGRASSIRISGTPCHRPQGQRFQRGGAEPLFEPTRRLDFELELGVFVGVGNGLGSPVPLDSAGDHLFGMCLLNDWSARDMQAWESQPLGPFLAKSFLSTISPWIVTFEALAPFRVPPRARGADEPAPLPYLDSARHAVDGGIDIAASVALQSRSMRNRGKPPLRIGGANARSLYWSIPQMLAHHTSNGCDMRSGDLFGTGTISGWEPGTHGCLLEATKGGREAIDLIDGERREFLEDGDEVVLRARCSAPGRVSIGFGECRGRVVASGL